MLYIGLEGPSDIELRVEILTTNIKVDFRGKTITEDTESQL